MKSPNLMQLMKVTHSFHMLSLQLLKRLANELVADARLALQPVAERVDVINHTLLC